jgi:hypothetical protein
MLCVCNHEEVARRRHAKRNETPFVERMIRIVARRRQGIEEYARSFIERDTLFPQVRGSL